MRGRGIRWVLAVALVAAAGAGAAMAMTATKHAHATTLKEVRNAKFGMILVNSSGRTLYRFKLDRKGVSVCTGACLELWPPLLVKATAKPTVGKGLSRRLLGTIKAAHGKRQVTYAGFPLYRFARDTKAGQTKGQGFGGKWYLVGTKGALVEHAVKAKKSSSGGAAWG